MTLPCDKFRIKECWINVKPGNNRQVIERFKR